MDDDERKVLDDLADVIHEELAVQAAIGRLSSPDDARTTADLIADVVWRGFDVRPRPE